MFFDKPNTLDPRILAEYEKLRHAIAQNKDWENQFNKRLTSETDPPLLELFHSQYRAQCLMEVARMIVHEHLPELDAIKQFLEWLPALVNHYHAAKGHDMVVVYATARTACVDPLSAAFIDEYTQILVENNHSVGTGASQTGGMGYVTERASQHIQRIGIEKTRSRTFGVRLGLIVDAGQPKANTIDFHAPPLYIFALRMYYLNLMGGCPDADEACKANSCHSEPPRRNRTIMVGGAGSVGEFIPDLVELQTSRFAHTCYTHVINQEHPVYVCVAPTAAAIKAYAKGDEGVELARIAERDNQSIAAWEAIRAKAVQIDTNSVKIPDRHDILGPMADALAATLQGSGLFYRGLLLQFADCLVNGTINGRELIPVSFVALDTPQKAARRTFELQSSRRQTIADLHGKHKISYRA